MIRLHTRTRWFLRGVLSLFGLTGIGLLAAGGVWYSQLPNVEKLAQENPQKTALMLYREQNGVRGGPVWIPLSEIAPELRNAVIVAEDWKFWQHHGVDWEATWEAFQTNWEKRRRVRGGSTITQQLAKNLYLDTSKTVWRKVNEIVIAEKMERDLTKPRILELYLNVVEWGRGIYGAESAARHYFGKSAAELNIEEASWLAAILPSPLRYDVKRDSRYVEGRAERIAHWVELRMNGHTALPPSPPEEPLEPEPLDEELILQAPSEVEAPSDQEELESPDSTLLEPVPPSELPEALEEPPRSETQSQ